ncbi:MAG: chemotaxis protein CheW [Cellvibrionaceae bacterium]|nr:chemotaxis protein CheW [Cellvibrionaceae bacterium]
MSDIVALGENPDEIACLLLPLVDLTLLIPTVTVAEMAPMRPVQSVEGFPDWLVGFYDWRQIKVPVISYESINGSTRHPLNPDGRMAVLNNTGVDKNLPYIAIPTQGIPRMARVTEPDINEHLNRNKRSFDLMSVKIGAEELAIPDIAALEHAYLEVSNNLLM